MSALVIDFSAYVKRESYRPTSSGEDQRKKEADLELLRKVKERLDKAERDGIDIEKNEVFIYMRESSNKRIAELEAELRYKTQALTVAKEKLAVEQRRKEKAYAAMYDAPSAAPRERLGRVDVERRRKPIRASVSRRARELVATAFDIVPAVLERKVQGRKYTKPELYAKLAYFKLVSEVLGIPIERLTKELELPWALGAPSAFVSRTKALLLEPDYINAWLSARSELEVYAASLEELEGDEA